MNEALEDYMREFCVISYRLVDGSHIIAIEDRYDPDQKAFYVSGAVQVNTNSEGRIFFSPWLINDNDELVRLLDSNIIASSPPIEDVAIQYHRYLLMSNLNGVLSPAEIKVVLAQLFNNDISGIYYSEYNSDFIQETTLEKNFENIDLFLRPYGVSNKFYDLILGSKNSYSNLRCHLNSRNFLYVNEGSIEVTMCVPNDIKYLYVNKNYETMEYVSEINICNVESKYMQNFNKVKFLRVIIPRNKIIQIPPYWFYHIKILEDNTLITAFKYRTIMNNISIIPDLFIKFLQDNNVKRNFTKIVS